MKTKVTVLDNSCRSNSAQFITDSMRIEYIKAGIDVPSSMKYILTKDMQKRQVQDIVETQYVYEGIGLQVAIKRAKRWLKNKQAFTGKVPRHIKKALEAFKLADEDAFNKASNIALFANN